MAENNKNLKVVFAGGGTGGHIYPGIAIADELKAIAIEKNIQLQIYWLGNKTGMDSSIIEHDGKSIDGFYPVSSGKLRRYLSFQNFIDLFKIIAGFFDSVRILKKLKPDFLFSKGGFVSVCPCKAAAFLHIPYFTHECDFTPGLATRLNSSKAKNILITYKETASLLKDSSKCIVTGNPVRPVFYEPKSDLGKSFLQVDKSSSKPILLVLGGSLGALQINNLVLENLEWLKERFIVVHQTGAAFAKENQYIFFPPYADEAYKPYPFIHEEMPYVLQCADIVVSRAGANSLWECAVCNKPMILIPLAGKGTRGDQVDNARYFENAGAAYVLAGSNATSENLKEKLALLLDKEVRASFSESCKNICGSEVPARKIASLILENIIKEV